MAHPTAIVFLTHLWDEVLARRFERLRRESAPHADCYLLLQDDDAEVVARWKAHLDAIGAWDRVLTFNSADLPRRLGLRYFGVQRIMSSTHFPLLLFKRTHPRYDYYWQVEGDVEYRGRWGDFFAAYEGTDAALLASHFHRYHDWPDWYWWASLTAPPEVHLQPEQMYKAFMPVMRLARTALDTVERKHQQGWIGHFEALIPTVLLDAGFRLEDLNVRKTCYVGWYQDPIPLFPLLATNRCRPPISLQEFTSRGEGPLIFHPVKERWTYDGEKVVVLQK